MEEIFVEGNKRIAIYDDLFSHHDRADFYNFAERSKFQIGWADGSINEHQQHRFLHSLYSEEDLNRMGILQKILESPAKDEIKEYKYVKTVLNLSTPADVNFVHTHQEDKILLYYVNLEWNDGWHGETLFFDESCKNISLACPYTPGRLISFNGHIPHAIRPQSYLSPFYRYTLAMVFNKG
jgi:hypothetical protein